MIAKKTTIHKKHNINMNKTIDATKAPETKRTFIVSVITISVIFVSWFKVGFRALPVISFLFYD